MLCLFKIKFSQVLFGEPTFGSSKNLNVPNASTDQITSVKEISSFLRIYEPPQNWAMFAEGIC